MENTTTVIANISEPQAPVSREPQQLLNALYWVWDAFERAAVPFFLVGQTAQDVIANKDLSGDKVEAGIRKMDWISGAKRVLDVFITPKEETETHALYEFEGIPVVLHIYEDSDCIINTDSKVYRYETFKVPNPMSEFERIYG